MMSMLALLGAPLAILEGVALIAVLGLALGRVIRVDRQAGLALAAGALIHLVSTLGPPLITVVALVVASSAGSSQEWLLLGGLLLSALPPVGRSVNLGCVAYSVVRLGRRVPPERRDVPESLSRASA